MVINFVMIAVVAVKRINKFMNAEELDPNNVSNNPSENALSIENGTFSWGLDEPTLKNINITVKRGKLSAVVGPVGCGKTSLISALLGEMDKIQGSVNVDGRIAYVPQQVREILNLLKNWFDSLSLAGVDSKCNLARQHNFRASVQQEILPASY